MNVGKEYSGKEKKSINNKISECDLGLFEENFTYIQYTLSDLRH